MKRILCVILAGVMLMAAGCGAQRPADPAPSQEQAAPSAAPEPAPAETPAPSAQKTELIISAAASLTDCMEELKEYYIKGNPDVTITFNFGASGTLQQQIEQGAPADVFISAGKKQMTALCEKGLMADSTVQDLLENKVVLIVPKDATPLASFEDLAGESVKMIAVGEPESVPVGQYTAEILENLGLTDKVKGKLNYAKDVREVLSWIETGNADAGIVYATDAQISGDKVQICATAPEGSHKLVIYPAGIVKDSKSPEEAKKFLDFLTKSDLAGATFGKYGFTYLREQPADI